MDTLKRINIPKILFDSQDDSYVTIPNKEFYDLFDLIYKREMLKDLSQYNLPVDVTDKFRTTILSCPIAKISRFNLKDFNPSEAGPNKPASRQKYDVFFTGQTFPERDSIVEELRKDKKIKFHGGLQLNTSAGKNVTPDLSFPRLSLSDYLKTIRNSKINLALEGHGQFTYRHLEVWYSASFLLSPISISKLNLPVQPIEGKHYVGFKDLKELKEKIEYYLNNPEERNQIARQGRKLFEQMYNPKTHGKFIRNELSKINPR